MITVYHRTDPTFRNVSKEEAKSIFLSGKIKLVAEVNTKSLKVAYKATTHIDDEWWNNRSIKFCPRPRFYRSTSVGDFLLKEEVDHLIYYQVMAIGFEEFAKVEF